MTDVFGQTIEAFPNPPTNPTEALLHTIGVYDLDQDSRPADSEMVIIATSNLYAHGIRTGLTWGDLRAIATAVKDQP